MVLSSSWDYQFPPGLLGSCHLITPCVIQFLPVIEGQLLKSHTFPLNTRCGRRCQKLHPSLEIFPKTEVQHPPPPFPSHPSCLGWERSGFEEHPAQSILPKASPGSPQLVPSVSHRTPSERRQRRGVPPSFPSPPSPRAVPPAPSTAPVQPPGTSARLEQGGMAAGVIVVHAVENGCLVFGELPVAEVVLQRREPGEGVLTRVSLLLAEADSFVR